jgi:hypothetical protein
MYINAKMVPVETVPGIMGEGMGKGGAKFKCDMFDTLQESL